MARACEPCRKHKVKCSGTRPCTRCVSREKECTYQHRRARSCDFCRNHKTKCSGTRPCSRCVCRKLECTYERRVLEPRPGSASPGDLSGFSPHGSPSSGDYGMGLEPALLRNQGEELTGAISIPNRRKEAVSSLEPDPAAVSATAPETLNYNTCQIPTDIVSGTFILRL